MNVGGNITEYHRDGAGVTAPVIFEGERVVTPGISSRTVVGQPTFMHGGLKDITAQSGPAGSITATRVYDAYGATLTGKGQWSGKFGYGGKYGYQEDGNELQLLGHRYYDASTGRFLTRDPIKDGRNWYGYCNNNPISQVDANGLRCSGTPFAISIGIRNLCLRIQSSIYGFMLRSRLGQAILGWFGVTSQAARDTIQRNAYTLQRGILELADEAETAARGFRPFASNLAEQLAMQEARNGGAGRVIIPSLSDPRYGGTPHEKVQVIYKVYDGLDDMGREVIRTINFHYDRNIQTGEGIFFKFKNDAFTHRRGGIHKGVPSLNF